MKKNLIKTFAISLALFHSINAVAQTAEEKPKVADLSKNSEKERTAPTSPSIAKEIAELKMLTEAPKPIVPGGDFKPMDTDKPVAVKTKSVESEKYQPPVMPAQKKAGPPPVVTELNADQTAKDRAKPAPIQQIVQKEQE